MTFWEAERRAGPSKGESGRKHNLKGSTKDKDPMDARKERKNEKR
jgi:hypothetical protein